MTGAREPSSVAPVQPGTHTLLAKADRAAAAAAAALGAGAPAMAEARAFGAMLCAAKALLNERGVRLRTHARIAAALARLIPANDLPLAAWLGECVARRHATDLEDTTFDAAAELVARAAAFVKSARDRIA